MRQEGLLSSTFFYFLNRVFLILFSFLLGLYASRFLTTSEYGTAQFINWNTTFIWMIANMGIPSVLNRFVPGSYGIKRFNQLLTHSFQLICLALLLAIVLTVVVTGTSDNYLPVTMALMGVHLLNYFVVSWMQSMQLYRNVFLVQTVASASALLIGYFIIPVYGLNGFIFCFFWLHTIGLLWLSFYFIKQVKQLKANSDMPVAAEVDGKLLIRSTGYFAISAVLSSILWQRSEYYFIKRELSEASVALYAVAFSVISLATEPFRLLTGTFTTYFARHFNQESDPSKMFTAMFKFIWMLTSFTSIFLWFFADQIVLFFYPEEYIASVSLIKILLPGVFLGACSYVVMGYHVAAGKAKFLLTQDSIVAIILIGLVLFSVHFYLGIEGIAWARSMALGTTVALGIAYSIWGMHLKFPFCSMLFSLLLSAGLMWLAVLLEPVGPVQLLFYGLVSFSCYVGVLIRLKVITPSELAQLKEKVSIFFKQSLLK
jgi:O-antigen/teichoic acid export membrane protein